MTLPYLPVSQRVSGAYDCSLQINLVAAQMVLDREHANRLVFEGQEGLDPVVDLSLRGAQIRALVQGRASTWHRHLVLTPVTAPAGEAVSTLLFCLSSIPPCYASSALWPAVP